MIKKLTEWVRNKRFRRSVRDWFRLCGDENLRLDYPLDDSSLVLDVGGFEGDFAAEVNRRYGCEVHVFEPVLTFFNALETRFEGNSSIILHPFGLGARSEVVTMSLEKNGSSHVKNAANENVVAAQILSFEDFISRSGILRVDLMKVNIEGAEFELLDHMLSKGYLPIIRDLQVQFHRFVLNSSQQRRAIRQKLAVTHYLTYDYYFVWENWRRKSGNVAFDGCDSAGER